MNPYDWIEKSLTTIDKANWYRQVTTIDGRSGAEITIDGKNLINFASNDYLGLSSDLRLIAAAQKALATYGTGSTGSRLLSGHRSLHRDLECAIATLKQTEDAIVFSSGYLANLGVIPALVGQKDLILGDRYNHASLKNGSRLSQATILEYDHNNLEDLQQKLQQNRHNYRRCLILSDSVFSMDGDLCPLPELISLAKQYHCMLLADEAHATGVMGKKGSGCGEYFGCMGEEWIQMGTLSKALASLGGYVAGSAKLVDFLRNRTSTWIYTTGLSLGDTAAALEAIHIVNSEPQRRQRLWRNVAYLQENLGGFDLLPSQSPIICLKLNNPTQALTLAQTLKTKGIFAPAIRPPTVPTSRLRFSVMTTHTQQQLQYLVKTLSLIINNLSFN
ncbi:MAG: 8-amino-7-oxononanoate synthase [Microcystaceae cyanobacterium]